MTFSTATTKSGSEHTSVAGDQRWGGWNEEEVQGLFCGDRAALCHHCRGGYTDVKFIGRHTKEGSTILYLIKNNKNNLCKCWLTDEQDATHLYSGILYGNENMKYGCTSKATYWVRLQTCKTTFCGILPLTWIPEKTKIQW